MNTSVIRYADVRPAPIEPPQRHRMGRWLAVLWVVVALLATAAVALGYTNAPAPAGQATPPGPTPERVQGVVPSPLDAPSAGDLLALTP